jgi:MATE family multidrug resistance protein
MLFVFMLVSTRAATRVGVEAGAAHQAIRQIWMLTALVLDAFALTSQSLIAYFLAAGRIPLARRVAAVSCIWGLGAGALLTCVMVLGGDSVALLLVPETARFAFPSAWLAAAIAQPLNALSFVTDGIHWGTRDYAYLRNAMIAATAIGCALLLVVDLQSDDALLFIWWVTGVWIGVRALFGVVRIWPGLGRGPLAVRSR